MQGGTNHGASQYWSDITFESVQQILFHLESEEDLDIHKRTEWVYGKRAQTVKFKIIKIVVYFNLLYIIN